MHHHFTKIKPEHDQQKLIHMDEKNTLLHKRCNLVGMFWKSICWLFGSSAAEGSLIIQLPASFNWGCTIKLDSSHRLWGSLGKETDIIEIGSL